MNVLNNIKIKLLPEIYWKLSRHALVANDLITYELIVGRWKQDKEKNWNNCVCVRRIGSKTAVLQCNKRLRGLCRVNVVTFITGVALENVRHNRDDRRVSIQNKKALSLTIRLQLLMVWSEPWCGEGFDVHCKALWKDNCMPDDYRIAFMLWETTGRHKIRISWWGKSRKERERETFLALLITAWYIFGLQLALCEITLFKDVRIYNTLSLFLFLMLYLFSFMFRRFLLGGRF